MRIRQSFGRQESADSRKPLINDDTDASTFSLASQQTTGDQQSSSSNDATVFSRNSSNISKLSRPMAVIHINDNDPVDGRPKKPPAIPQQQAPKSQIKRKSSAPDSSIHNEKPSETQVSSSDKKCSSVQNNTQSSSSRRTAGLRDANLPEERLRLKHTSSGGSNSQSNSVRPVRKTASQRQGYGSKFTRAFTRKSGFNLIFDEVTGGSLGSFDSDSASDIETDLQRFESLYRKVHKKLKKRSRQSIDEEEGEQTHSSSDPEMSPDSEDDKKVSCQEMFVGRRMRKWAFWFIVAFLAALTIKDVVELVTEYLENPKQSVINVVFNDTMTMPNMTFCLSKNQAYSHFNLTVDNNWDSTIDSQLAKLPDKHSFLQKPWDYRMVVEGYEVISSLSSMERETESNHGIAHAFTKFRESPRLESKRNMIKKWTDALESRDITFEQFTQKVGVEVIRPSMQRFQRLTFNDDQQIQTKFRTTWISEKQFCFQPWSHEAKYMLVEDQGHFFAMNLLHNGENLSNKSVNCMSVDFHGRPSSLNRFMQGKGRTRDGYDDELCPGQYHEIVVEVKALYEMLENEDNGTMCREQKPNEDNEFDCKSRCRMEMIRQLCKCTPLTLSYLIQDSEYELKRYPLCDYTTCILDANSQNYTDLECQSNCHRDCRQIRYTVNHKTQGRLLRPDMTVLELHWGSFEYLRMQQDWVWSVTTFIAALGGSIGMWLGLSILSLIQGGSYLYSYVSDNVIKKKIRKRRESVISPVPIVPAKTIDDTELVINPFGNPFKQMSLRQHTATPSLSQNKEARTSIQIE